MFTATAGLMLPTTVTGSWPRPAWYDEGLRGRDLSQAMVETRYREQFADAVSAVISDQERAGLDIVTNGDYHLDPDVAGLSWARYPVERFAGVEPRHVVPSSDEWTYRAGTLLSEVVGAWRFPTVVGHVEGGRPLELDKIWRVAQSRTDRPVKMGVVSTQLSASMLQIRTEEYAADKRDLMWDLATAMNAELRSLAAAGCRVIQVEEPLMHFVAATSRDREYIDFLVDCFNHEISGLEDVEVWIHTCWGNPNMQRVLKNTTYAEAVEVFLERVGGDVWTVEMRDQGFADLALLEPFRGSRRKKIALGVVSHRALQVERPDEVAADIRTALRYIEPENLVLSSDCGFGRGGFNRLVAFYKAAAIAQGANIVRRELGLPETAIRAADPALQIDTRPRSGS